MLKLFRLAWPVILSYLAIMTMGLVDLVFVGRVSPEAVGGVGIGTSVFSWFMMLGIGILTGLDPMVSQAFGAGDRESCFRSFVQGLWVVALVTWPSMGALYYLSFHLDWLGVNLAVAAEAGPYLRALVPSMLGVLVFQACRQYLQSMSVVKVSLWIMLGANLVNALFNWLLVFGNWGFPKMGAAGSSLATTIARTFMAVVIILYLRNWDRKNDQWFSKRSLQFEAERMWKLLKLGVPAALQFLFEVGFFAFATVLAGRFEPVEVAAHQIVLNAASLTFMVPLGIGSATSVLVGQAIGRGDLPEARSWGWTSLGLGTSFMACSALVFLVFPTFVLGAYTSDSSTIQFAQGILLIAGLFQLSDGAQAVASGALRGMGQLRETATAHLVGHWLVGLPIALWLGVYGTLRLQGLWIGLSAGLTFVAITLIWRWRIATQREIQRVI